MKITTFAHPSHIREELIQGSACAVIDVLRMTSTACTALANGADGIFMTKGVEEAREIAKARNALLGGERGGVKLEGFDFGNSPLEYKPESVKNRSIVMSTSNGTQAVCAAKGAKRILLASFLNVSAAAKTLSGEESVMILCAGTNGLFSMDDALCAGALAERLNAENQCDLTLCLRALYRDNRRSLDKALSQAHHYRRLVSLGFTDDLSRCLTEDALSCVPEMQPDGWFADARS